MSSIDPSVSTVRVVTGTKFTLTGSVNPTVVLPPYTPVFPDELASSVLEFHVYDPSNTTYIGTVRRRQTSSFTEELNSSGTGTLIGMLNDPVFKANPEILRPRNVVRAYLDGDLVFAWQVRGGDTTLIGPGEDTDRTTPLAGPGGLEVLKEAYVRPEFTITKEPTRSANARTFGYMTNQETKAYYALMRQNSWYDPDKWVKGFARKHKAPEFKNSLTPRNAVWPAEWPDADASWLWASDPLLPANPGDVYFRGKFTMKSVQTVGVYATGDNNLQLWLDDILIIDNSANSDNYQHQQTFTWIGEIAAGKHRLAAKVTNSASDTLGKQNYGAFICTVTRVVDQVPVYPSLYHTGEARKEDAYAKEREPWLLFYQGNPLPKKKTKTTTSKKPSKQYYYTVRKGDYLIKIGKKFGVDWRKILTANQAVIDQGLIDHPGVPGRPDGWWIFPGQKLKIPGKYVKVSSTTKTTSWKPGTLTTEAPGWYPHQILARLLYEAKVRGVASLQAVENDFEYDTDSDGTPWPVGEEFRQQRQFNFGISVYDAAQQMVDGGMDIHMTPDFKLQAFVQMGTDRGLLSAKPLRILQPGYTALTYTVTRLDAIVNEALVGVEDGWADFSQEQSQKDVGRIEGSITLGGIESSKVVASVGEALLDLAYPKKQVTLTFLYSEALKPYRDFGLGDIVVVENEVGNEFDARITTMTINEVSENVIQVTVQAVGRDYLK